MKVDLSLTDATAGQAFERSRDAELAGFDGVWTADFVSDAFLVAVGAALGTQRVDIGTAIAVAFARNPMSTAYAAWELARSSNGRFTVGLGTQIRPHIERRFSMPWSDPLDRLVDFVGALRAIWACWRDGGRLEYEGEFYRHTLMSPMFTPPSHEFPLRVFGAAVGPAMARLVGEHLDGLVGHPFITPEYFDAVVAPSLPGGGAVAPREFTVYYPLMILAADGEEDMVRLREQARTQVAFYGSTPAYRVVLDSLGYGDLQPALRKLSRSASWDVMTDLVDDTLLDAMTIGGTPEEIPKRLRDRWGDRLDRVSSIYPWPAEMDRDRIGDMVMTLRRD